MKHAAARDLMSGAGPSYRQATPQAARPSQSDILDIHLAHAVPKARGGGRADPMAVLGGIDARAFKTWFAPKFAEWLQGNFRSPEHVAYLFGVRNSTAWNWWNGDNRASGDAVALVFISFPDAAAWFLAEWGRR